MADPKTTTPAEPAAKGAAKPPEEVLKDGVKAAKKGGSLLWRFIKFVWPKKWTKAKVWIALAIVVALIIAVSMLWEMIKTLLIVAVGGIAIVFGLYLFFGKRPA